MKVKTMKEAILRFQFLSPKKIGKKILYWWRARKERKRRKKVLDWALKFAEHYSEESTVDFRTMPIRIPLAVLILTIDGYIRGGPDKLDKYKRFNKEESVVEDEDYSSYNGRT